MNRRNTLTLIILLLFTTIFTVNAQSLKADCVDTGVFYSDGEIITKPMDDLTQTGKRLSTEIENLQPSDFAWSNSTQTLAFVSYIDNSIYIVDKPNPTPHLLLTLNSNTKFSNLTWSPDGRFLAYYRYIPDKNHPEKSVGFIEGYDFQGKSSKQILEPFPNAAFIGYLDSLVWSPDGNEIAISLGIPPYENKIYLISSDCILSNQTQCQLQNLEVKNINNWEQLTEGQTEPAWSKDAKLWFICGGEYCIYEPTTMTVERNTKPDLQHFMLLSCGQNFIFQAADETVNLYNVVDKTITKTDESQLPEVVIPFPAGEFLIGK